MGRVIFRSCAFKDNVLNVIFDNGVMAEYDVETDRLKPMGKIEGFDLKEKISGPMLNMGNSFFVLDDGGRKVNILDRDANKLQSVVINAGNKFGNNYFGHYLYQEKLYIFPHEGKKYFVVDGKENKWDEIRNKELFNQLDKGKETVCANQGSRMCFLQRNSTKLISLDLLQNRITMFDLQFQNELGIIRYMTWEDSSLYLLTDKGAIYKWDESKNAPEVFSTAVTEKSYRYTRMAFVGNKIWMLPGQAEDIYCIDRISGNRQTYSAYPADYQYVKDETWLSDYAKYWDSTENENHICYANKAANYTLFLDKKTGEAFFRKIELTIEMTYEFCKKNKMPCVLNEKEGTLEELIHLVCKEH